MAAPTRERRNGKEPIPENLEEYLNEDQLATLNHMAGFGWHLAFVRRPLFQDPVPILCNPDNHTYAALNEDGTLNPDVYIR